jgi:hypothetical protein
MKDLTPPTNTLNIAETASSLWPSTTKQRSRMHISDATNWRQALEASFDVRSAAEPNDRNNFSASCINSSTSLVVRKALSCESSGVGSAGSFDGSKPPITRRSATRIPAITGKVFGLLPRVSAAAIRFFKHEKIVFESFSKIIERCFFLSFESNLSGMDRHYQNLTPLGRIAHEYYI